jgi:hypothetical protein
MIKSFISKLSFKSKSSLTKEISPTSLVPSLPVEESIDTNVGTAPIDIKSSFIRIPSKKEEEQEEDFIDPKKHKFDFGPSAEDLESEAFYVPETNAMFDLDSTLSDKYLKNQYIAEQKTFTSTFKTSHHHQKLFAENPELFGELSSYFDSTEVN